MGVGLRECFHREEVGCSVNFAVHLVVGRYVEGGSDEARKVMDLVPVSTPSLVQRQVSLNAGPVLRSVSALSVSIRHLGLARTGRNPKPGEPVEVPSRKVPVFQSSTLLRERLDPRITSSPGFDSQTGGGTALRAPMGAPRAVFGGSMSSGIVQNRRSRVPEGYG